MGRHDRGSIIRESEFNIHYTLAALQPRFALGSLGVLSRAENKIEATLAVLCR